MTFVNKILMFVSKLYLKYFLVAIANKIFSTVTIAFSHNIGKYRKKCILFKNSLENSHHVVDSRVDVCVSQVGSIGLCVVLLGDWAVA